MMRFIYLTFCPYPFSRSFGWMRYECDDGTPYYYNAARDDYMWKAPEDLYDEDDSGMFVEPPSNHTPKVTFDIS